MTARQLHVALASAGLASVLCLSGCPETPAVTGPGTPATPAPVTEWVACAQELGFHPEAVTPEADGTTRVALFTPTRAALAAQAEAPIAQLLQWHTPALAGRWALALAEVDGELTLLTAEPRRFADAQRLIVVSERCGRLAPGAQLVDAFSNGAVDAEATGYAVRLVIDACGEGDACPDGWRARLLTLAGAQKAERGAAGEGRCADNTAPEADRGASLARDLRAWALDEVGPAPGASTVDWALALHQAGIGSGETPLRARFDALVDEGDLAGAGGLVVAAVHALQRCTTREKSRCSGALSERLRYDGARALVDAGEGDRARPLLEALAAKGSTIYSDFAQDDLAQLDAD